MRELTELEHNIVAHVVVDPVAWWDHANHEDRKVDAEQALAEKIARHSEEYLAASAEPDYKNRAQRDAAEALNAPA